MKYLYTYQHASAVLMTYLHNRSQIPHPNNLYRTITYKQILTHRTKKEREDSQGPQTDNCKHAPQSLLWLFSHWRFHVPPNTVTFLEVVKRSWLEQQLALKPSITMTNFSQALASLMEIPVSMSIDLHFTLDTA